MPGSSSIFSSSSELSVLSPDPAVEFSPKPVFKDEVPEELFMQRGESASAPVATAGFASTSVRLQLPILKPSPSPPIAPTPI